MPILSKTLSKEWNKAFSDYERISGFEPMYQEDIDEGTMTVDDAWALNVKFLEDMLSDVTHIVIPEAPELI
ncbi:hypothetical protein HNW13_017485 [Shewanella sp. BF02_Schw]|uniref:hypothetical protein n=1 Tax=Shewanella sp. BF02_Schw TaxID=394908 RepID=UPI00177B48DD|nr:hypothetical protein [Shewanella sp. BF02_Schw]MBO1897532.1 hypothetical protein [Shewanella sp. BF02_Schw]